MEWVVLRRRATGKPTESGVPFDTSPSPLVVAGGGGGSPLALQAKAHHAWVVLDREGGRHALRWTSAAVRRLRPYFLNASAYSARGNGSPLGTFIMSA
jgi:hypothetical protein